jgi:hypothetical protein
MVAGSAYPQAPLSRGGLFHFLRISQAPFYSLTCLERRPPAVLQLAAPSRIVPPRVINPLPYQGPTMTAVTTQAWMTVAGLSLDFLGFCLLLREWWLAFFSEKSQMEYEEALERQQKLRAFGTQTASEPMKRHLATTGQMQDDMAIRRARDERRATQAGRKRWFASATVLVVLGFILQLAGALPA